jgi:NAD(P)-dependent dehydrogenase (short-subunit alcohol dehydrogenase family)
MAIDTTSPHPAIAPAHVAVITGGANGIGLATARLLMSAGMRICLIDRDGAALVDARTSLALGEDRLMTLPVNVADRAEMENAAQTVREAWGPVSVIMNNAAIGGGGDALADPLGWERLIGVNLMGVFHGISAFVPDMVAGDAPGLVINTGSKQGITQPPGNTAYNVAKSGVKSLTEGLAHTLREKTGGRVSAHLLVPGFTYTGMMKRHLPEKPDAAWTPEQVADYLMEGLARSDFYILCPDNETTPEMDRKRMAWALGDVIEGRPALSRWHPDYKAEFDSFMNE